MNHTELTLDEELRGVRRYGFVLIGTLLVLHIVVWGALSFLEVNDLRSELTKWSLTLHKPNSSGQEEKLYLPEGIIAFHVNSLDRTGFYTTKTDRNYLAFANPENNYILIKSKQEVERETQNFAITLGALFAGEMILLLGWWRFVRMRVRELFEPA